MPQENEESSSTRVARPAEPAEFFRSHPDPDLGILTVRGELDISTSGMLRKELNELLDGGTQRVEVDLSGVVFMDSSALSTLVGAHDRASEHSLHLELVNPSPACAKVLGITGLDRVFNLS
jgi:anti-sigma B factor antagonist